MSELEIAEALLRKRKRRKRKKSSHLQPSTSVPTAFNPANDSPIAKNKKRKLKLQINSDSDSDGDFFV